MLLPSGNAKRPHDATKNDRPDVNMFTSSEALLNLRAAMKELRKHKDAPSHLLARLALVSNLHWMQRVHIQHTKSDAVALLKRLGIPRVTNWTKKGSWHAAEAVQFDARCAVMVEVVHFPRDRLDARFVVPGADGAWSSTPTSEECFRTSLQDATSNQTTPFGADFVKIWFDKRKRGKLAISDDVESLNARIRCYMAQLELPEMRRRADATDEMPHRTVDIVAAVTQRRRERVSTRREISETTLVAALTEHMQKKEPHCDDYHSWFFKPDLGGPQYYFGTRPRS